MWNTPVALMNSVASLVKKLLAEKRGKGTYKLKRFLCSTVPCACCSRGGNCSLLSCQWYPGKGLSVHKSTKELSPKCKITTRKPLLFLSLLHSCIYKQKDKSTNPPMRPWTLTKAAGHSSKCEITIISSLHLISNPMCWKACFYMWNDTILRILGFEKNAQGL